MFENQSWNAVVIVAVCVAASYLLFAVIKWLMRVASEE